MQDLRIFQDVHYISGSQPFELQVPVDVRFLSKFPSHQKSVELLSQNSKFLVSTNKENDILIKSHLNYCFVIDKIGDLISNS